MKNMTEGSSAKLILNFALPLLGGNLFQQFYNIVDAAIVGRTLGGNALAGVGATSSVQFLVLGFCSGLATGFAIPVAQQFGAGEEGNMRRTIFHSFVLTAVFAFGLMALTALLCPQILMLLRTPDNIHADAYSYLVIIFLGIPCTLLYNTLAAILRAVGDSKTPFLFLVFSTVLNIFLDLLCIITFGWGVAGAAIATVVSQGISGILCLRLMFKRYRQLLPEKAERSWEKKRAGYLMTMGVPMGLQFSITAIGSMVMQSANNALGSTYVSGFTAGTKIKQFAMCPFDAFSAATSTFVSQNLGAKKMNRIRQGLRTGLIISVTYGAIAGLALIFGGRMLSQIFLSADHVYELDAAGQYLRSLGYFFTILGVLNVNRLVTQGLGYPGKAIFAGAIEMAARSLVSIFLVPVYGYTAICFCDQTAWVSATIYITIVLAGCLKKTAGICAEEE